MSEENKTREPPNPDIFGPPFFGIGLGEKLGSIDARIIRLESDMAEVKHDLKDLMNAAVNRLSERLTGLDERLTGLDERLTGRLTALEQKLDGNTRLLWGMFMALLTAIIVQKLI